MYADPSLIRDVVIKVRLNEKEENLLDAVVAYTGQQKSTLMRELFIESAMRVLSGQSDIESPQLAFQEPQMSTFQPR